MQISLREFAYASQTIHQPELHKLQMFSGLICRGDLPTIRAILIGRVLSDGGINQVKIAIGPVDCGANLFLLIEGIRLCNASGWSAEGQ